MTLPTVFEHDVQQRLQRRTGLRNAAIFEIQFRHASLRGDNVVHAVHKNVHVLQFRLQHLVRKDGLRMIEDAGKKGAHEARGDAIAQPAGQNLLATQVEVLDIFRDNVQR